MGVGEEPERLQAREIEGIRHAWSGELTARTDEALGYEKIAQHDIRALLAECELLAGERDEARAECELLAGERDEARAECELLAGRVAALEQKVSDDRIARWSMRRHLDTSKARLEQYEKELVALADVGVSERVFAQCVGFLTQKDVWLFEVDREFASEEWSDPVQYRFNLEPGAYPQMEIRRIEPKEGS